MTNVKGLACPCLQFKSVTVRYGLLTPALTDISFSCRRGEITLLLGHNGSGKSTLLRAAAGLQRLDSGEVIRISSKIAYLGHDLMLYDRLTVRENLKFFSDLNSDCRSNPADLELLLDRWQLRALADRAISDLSKGQGWRVALCRALLGEPEIILLDEPSAALDINAVENFTRSLAEVAINAAVLIATHDLKRLQGLGARAVVLQQGKLVADSIEKGIDTCISQYQGTNR